MNRLIPVACLALILLGVTGCEQQPDGNTVTLYDEGLAAALDDRATTLTTPRPAIAFQDGTVADSCETYLDHRKFSDLSETVDNQLVKSEYLVCELLALLEPLDVTAAEVPENHEISAKLESGLDLTTFPSSLAQLVDDEHRFPASLEALEFEIAPIPAGLRLSRDQQSLSVTVVAVGDIDHDGETDWIVTLSDEILDATYRDYSVGLISNVSASPLTLKRL